MTDMITNISRPNGYNVSPIFSNLMGKKVVAIRRHLPISSYLFKSNSSLYVDMFNTSIKRSELFITQIDCIDIQNENQQ